MAFGLLISSWYSFYVDENLVMNLEIHNLSPLYTCSDVKATLRASWNESLEEVLYSQ